MSISRQEVPDIAYFNSRDNQAQTRFSIVKTMSGGVYIGPIGTEEEAAALWEATLAEQQEAARGDSLTL